MRGLVVVLNGDVLADLDLSAMLRFHRERGARATLYLTRVSDPTQYGLVELESNGAIRAFVEKPEPDRVTTDTVNAGVYALDRSVVTAIPTGRAVSIERETFPGLLRDRVPFFGWVSGSYWLDIGSPAKYRQGQLDLLAGKVATDVAPPGDARARRFVAPGAHVAPDAAVAAPCVIGPGSRLEAGARVGPNAVLGANCVVGAGAHVEGAIPRAPPSPTWPGSRAPRRPAPRPIRAPLAVGRAARRRPAAGWPNGVVFLAGWPST